MTGSSFSIATTAFVSLAICAIISYGVFYYFKQRLSLIEQSQMEQARILQAIISRGLLPQHSAQQQQQATHQLNSEQQAAQQCHKEITITQNSLIEVSSDDESETDSESESSDTESESGSGTESDKWSIGDEIHQSDEYHKEFNEMSERMRALSSSEKKQIHIDNSENIDNIETIDDIGIETIETNADDTNTKKIISLKSTLTHDEHESDDEEDSSSSSSESESEEKPQDFELKIGYKSASGATNKTAVHLNYGNMSVPALRQLAKERGLGGDEADLQKLKKKDLVQLLQ